MRKIKPSFEEENKLWNLGTNYVIGIDEVGRGAFAGPIVAAGVVFSSQTNIDFLTDVNDSKLLGPKLRKKCSEIIKKQSILWAVEEIGLDYINKFGIGKANSAVFRKVLKKLITQINGDYFVLIDGIHRKFLPGGLKKQKGIIKGDQLSLSIASASIIAKVYRDNLMRKANKQFPKYGFSKNKGYGTREHHEAIRSNGICEYHRSSFIHNI